MTLPTDPAYGQVSAPTEPGQTEVGGRPMLTLTAAAAACAVSRSTLRRRLAGGAFPNAVRDADGAWTVPVGDLLAAGLRVNAPQVGRRGQPAVSMPTGAAHPVLTGAGEQAQTGRPKPALAARVAELEWALAVERERREGAERLAAERGARIEDLRVSLRMLESVSDTHQGRVIACRSVTVLSLMPASAPAEVVWAGTLRCVTVVWP